MVKADPVTAAEAISKSRLFIFRSHLERIQMAFSAFDCNRCKAKSLDIGNKPFRREHLIELCSTTIESLILMDDESQSRPGETVRGQTFGRGCAEPMQS